MSAYRSSILWVEREPGVVHLWLGRLGLHLHWPRIWSSTWQWLPRWKEELIWWGQCLEQSIDRLDEGDPETANKMLVALHYHCYLFIHERIGRPST